VIARQQDKKKDKPYLLPLRGGQLYCHGHIYFAAKKLKIEKKVRK